MTAPEVRPFFFEDGDEPDEFGQDTPAAAAASNAVQLWRIETKIDTLTQLVQAHIAAAAAPAPAASTGPACSNCKTGRRRCSRGGPCGECAERGLKCSYRAR